MVSRYMDNVKNDKYYALKIVENIDAIQYEFKKLCEDSIRLSTELRVNYPELHINNLRS